MRHRLRILTIITVFASVFSSCDNVTEGALVYVVVSDAAHDGPSERFYLLPPIVEQPVFSGDFDDSLSPIVSIPSVGAEFTITKKPGSDYIRVDLEEELYIVNWKTEAYNIQPNGEYHIYFKLGDEVIGSVEIRVYENVEDIVIQGDEIKTGFQPGRTIPIKFRIENPVQ